MMGLLIACASAPAVEPFSSSQTHLSANGYGVLVYDGDRLSHGWNHVYQKLNSSATSLDILYDTYFGYTDLDGSGAWLLQPESVGTLGGTGIIVSAETRGDLEFTQYAFMPMTLDAWGVVQVTRVRNTSSTDNAPRFQLTSLHNWKPGSGETVATYASDEVVERGSSIALWYRAPDADENSCEQVYTTVLEGRRIAGECAGYSSDNVPGFGWSIPALGPGAESWHGVFISQDASPDYRVYADGPQAWLTEELAWWGAFHERAVVPDGLNTDETSVYQHQLALLAMSQVREVGAPYGQIPASFPVAAPDVEFPHTWNITWVRDSSYATVALANAGYVAEAEASVRFLFQEGKAGKYKSWLSNTNYGVSVCRLYGDGSEWSDEDATGPNIELDNWGLYLWALAETVAAAGTDSSLLTELGLRALDEVADPLVAMVIPGTNLIRADSSIWERHWYGNEKSFTYTSVMAVAGLRAAAELATLLADPRAQGYLDTADAIALAISTHLVDDDGVVAGNLTELNAGSGYLDIAAAEAWNFDVLDARGETFAPTIAMWDTWLGSPASVGYRRNDDGSAYDEQEWAFADLRVSTAMRRACEVDRARLIEDWVTDQALVNGRQIPELYDPETGSYEGPTPMLGFGAGLYLLAMQERALVSEGCPAESIPPDPVDTSGDTSEPPDDTCQCVSGGASAAWPALAAMWWVRRRVSSKKR